MQRFSASAALAAAMPSTCSCSLLTENVVLTGSFFHALSVIWLLRRVARCRAGAPRKVFMAGNVGETSLAQHCCRAFALHFGVFHHVVPARAQERHGLGGDGPWNLQPVLPQSV